MLPTGAENSSLGRCLAGPLLLGAVVLAAGASSRMGAVKALLPLGTVSALERVVTTLRAAGISEIVVVTGHRGQELEPELARLGVRWTRNPCYEKGMFSSVQAGAAALSQGQPALDAFFVWPIDCPLVPPQVLQHLVLAYQAAKPAAAVIHPCCLGRRGHPPLLATRLLEPLVQAQSATDLRSFLAGYDHEAREVEVRNPTILMDMDTPEDHRRMSKFAALLDQAGATESEDQGPARRETRPGSHPQVTPHLTEEDCTYLLKILGVPDRVQRHCRAVAEFAMAVGRPLVAQGQTLDLDLVHSACLLHDLAKGQRKHAVVAEEILTSLGSRRLAQVVGCHMIIPSELVDGEALTEEGLVYLADKLVREDRIVHLEERSEETARLYGSDSAALEGARHRIGAATHLLNKVDRILGRRALTEIRVYLVRHAPSVAPVRRAPSPAAQRPRCFVGQADHPLGEEGVAQARALALRLKDIPFDAAYASDLARSVFTAEILLEGRDHAVPLHRDPALREIDTGLWEGFSSEEAKRLFPEEHERREADVARTPFPGGESFEDLQRRVVLAFERILAQESACLAAEGKRVRNVLLVSHKNANRVLLGHLLGLPLEEALTLAQDYCAVSLIRVVTLADGSRRVHVEMMEA